MNKKILIINAHPDKESFAASLALVYQNGAKNSGAECHLLHLSDLKFDPILRYGYRVKMELEPDLIKAQQEITWADHLVFIYPNWWGTYPALLKGFFDRLFLPGFAFKYRKNSQLWDKLLKGKTARLIVTMNTPLWYNFLVYRNAGYVTIKKCILQFCGINPVKITALSGIRFSEDKKRELWQKKIEALGKKQK